jgi:uncharacterized protein YndB with AHSA1/START domain
MQSADRRGQVEREILLPARPEDVWDSLTRSESLSSWLGSSVELDPRPGGVLRMESDQGARMGVVESVVPFEYLALRWRPLITGPEGPMVGPGTRVEFFVKEFEDGTRLRVVETLLSTAAVSHRGQLRAMVGSLVPRLRAATASGTAR